MSMTKGFIFKKGHSTKYQFDKDVYNYFDGKKVVCFINPRYIDIKEHCVLKSLRTVEQRNFYSYLAYHKKLFYLLYSKRYKQPLKKINEVMKDDFKTYLRRVKHKIDYESHLSHYVVEKGIFFQPLADNENFKAILVASFQYPDSRVHLLKKQDSQYSHKAINYILVEHLFDEVGEIPEIMQVDEQKYRVTFNNNISFHLYDASGYNPQLFAETKE